jgi:CheY-like chemotaxis protein
MPQGGSLFIQTEVLNGNELISKKFVDYKHGKYAHISVADTGIGISQETADRIFEPFFTTKEEGKGTGLGLSIVHGVITQHGGHIEVQSETEKGTVFHMYLPLAPYQKERTRTPVVHRSVGGTETILIAEDNEPVRILVRNILSEYGYSILESIDGEDALNKFRDSDNTVDLLLLDVILPKIDGKSVYDEIKKITPDIKALFMSGYTTDVVQKHGVFENEFNFIQKPVMPHILLGKVREVLDTR